MTSSENSASIENGQTWKHLKSGNYYKIVCAGKLQLDGAADNSEMVVYYSVGTAEHWVRFKNEFLKRFARVD